MFGITGRCRYLGPFRRSLISLGFDIEKDAFLKELGITQPARETVVKLAYNALGYITFFTVKGNETKAWPVKSGTRAIEAAGKIHSDIEKGFIKAEVIKFDDFTHYGSEIACKEAGRVSIEGKEYVVKDGDVIYFRFNV